MFTPSGKIKKPSEVPQDLLGQFSEEKPFVIILSTENLDDGIGDFVHLYDFNEYLKEKYQDENRVRVQCACFISQEKLEVINKIYGKNYEMENVSPPQDIKKNDGIVFFRRKSESSEPALQDFLKKNTHPDVWFAVSVRPRKLEALEARSTIILKEYESSGEIEAVYGDKWKFVRSMGITHAHSKKVGIKIIRPVLEAKQNLEEKESHYESDYLNFLHSEDPDAFFGAGYLQSRFQSDIFILECLNLARDQKNINIIINHNDISALSAGIFSAEKLNQYIENKELPRLSRIEVVSFSGDLIFEKNIPDSTNGQVLRIVQFSGISENDKALLYASADSVAASGDTSCSELICSKAIPYIGKKGEFIQELIALAGDRKFSSLVSYLEDLKNIVETENSDNISGYLDSKNYETMENELLDKHQDKINISCSLEAMLQWNDLCESIIQNSNVYNFTDRLMECALRHSQGLLKKGDVDKENLIKGTMIKSRL